MSACRRVRTSCGGWRIIAIIASASDMGGIARASPAGLTTLKRYIVADSPTWAQPAISGQRFFIKDRSILALLWTIE